MDMEEEKSLNETIADIEAEEAELEKAEAEEAEATETEAPEAETEETEEPEAGADGKPKKERKMNWAKKGGKKAEEAKDDPAAGEIESLKAQVAETNDKYARLFAEFDNFRKRSEKEKAQMYDFGAKAIVEKILPVVDNFERGLALVPEDEKSSPFVEGMDKIYKQLMTTLEELNVKPIEAVGKEFNTDFHQAVMHVEDESVGENIVVEEFQKGYMYKDSVVRYSMVKVAN